MQGAHAIDPAHGTLGQQFRQVRERSEALCAPLAPDDYQIQSITETSPPKWHLAHVTWFFETFVLGHFIPDYRPFHPAFAYLFNSYYQTIGAMQPRPDRGLLSRPTVEEVYRYRAGVDEQVLALIETVPDAQRDELVRRIILGLHHEQQHQELLLMDIKHNFSVNPLAPAYQEDLREPSGSAPALGWIERPGGIREIGHQGQDFAFDNETPRHRVLTEDHRLASRLVTNGEYLAFVADRAYTRPELWLADGWALLGRLGWRHPLYWRQQDGQWSQFTLGGLRPLSLDEPVCHLSFYEADAYARWAGRRLPTEAELEIRLSELPPEGNFVSCGLLHPAPGEGQWYGDLWEWTASAYTPYPGFEPLEGSMGEYNGKFMCNQMVLRGGCCASPDGHLRASYRNFFYPHDRWQFSGLRLAEDA
jgi:ergothioneine biosynthesis protein EgtB